MRTGPAERQHTHNWKKTDKMIEYALKAPACSALVHTLAEGFMTFQPCFLAEEEEKQYVCAHVRVYLCMCVCMRVCS